MDYALVLLFFAALYSIIGYASKGIFQQWCTVLFSYDHKLGNAAGTICATLWPLGWPAIVLIGLINACLVIYQAIHRAAIQIRKSFRVIYDHYRSNEQGEQ